LVGFCLSSQGEAELGGRGSNRNRVEFPAFGGRGRPVLRIVNRQDARVQGLHGENLPLPSFRYHRWLSWTTIQAQWSGQEPEPLDFRAYAWPTFVRSFARLFILNLFSFPLMHHRNQARLNYEVDPQTSEKTLLAHSIPVISYLNRRSRLPFSSSTSSARLLIMFSARLSAKSV